MDLNKYITTKELSEFTGLSVRFWEARRISGNSPPFLYISSTCIRYQLRDVMEWLEKTKTNITVKNLSRGKKKGLKNEDIT